MPLTATIAPAASAWAAAALGSPGNSGCKRRRGPHSAQAFGCAWWRRSAGSSYSARQASHIVNAAMVVSGRSYGMPRTIVNRGPQWVLLMNG